MITIELLNQMAIADGEDPFDEGTLDQFDANDLCTETLDGDSINPEALVAFTRELRNHIKLPKSNAQAEQRLEAFVHNFGMESTNNFDKTFQDKKKPFFDLTQFLPKSFFSFGSVFNGGGMALPAGGTFALAACAVLFFTTQGTATQDWEFRYAEIAGASNMNEVYEIGAGTPFFEKPAMAVRGQKIAHLSKDLSEHQVSDYVENDVGLDTLVPVLRATQAQGLTVAKIPEHQLWLLFRGNLHDELSSESSGEKKRCHLIEAIQSEALVPPSDEKGVFLKYCPLQWTKKLSMIQGGTGA